MAKMKWSELSPRERDALVAEKVMGCTVIYPGPIRVLADVTIDGPSCGCESDSHRRGGSLSTDSLKRYSEDIAAAWEVVKNLTEDGWVVETMSSEFGGTDCKMTCNAQARGRHFSDCMNGYTHSAAEAICFAALKACGLEIE